MHNIFLMNLYTLYYIYIFYIHYFLQTVFMRLLILSY